MKKSFIRRTMVFFIAICLIPFLIYTAILISKTGDIEQQRIAGSLEAIAEEKAAALQKDLKNIENETINLAEWASYLMAQDSNIPGSPRSINGMNEEFWDGFLQAWLCPPMFFCQRSRSSPKR